VAHHVCARHFLTSMGSETTLGCLAANRAAVECPEYLSLRHRPMMLLKRFMSDQHSRPGERAKCSAWAGCLG
jgi:hypothetical protein